MRRLSGPGAIAANRRLRRAALIAGYLGAVTLAGGWFLESVFRARNGFGYIRSASPGIVYELRPEYREHNSAGYRDREYSRRKPPQVFRVIGLGDSVTFGVGVPRERVFLKVAEEVLNRDGDSQRFEVLNLGVPGYNSAMMAALLEERTAEWEPDLIVIEFCRNDFNLPNFLWTERNGPIAHSFALHEALKPLAKVWPDFVKHSIMGYFYDGDPFPVPGLEHAPLEGNDPIKDPARSPPRYRYMLLEDGVRAAFARIFDQARRRWLPVFLLLGWGGRYQDVKQIADTEGLPVIDIWPAVTKRLIESGRDFQTLWIDPVRDSHPNQEGHEIIGAQLAVVIRIASQYHDLLVRHFTNRDLSGAHRDR